ncbi:hypothetical protein C8R44DRAFT_294890 [Mycena epipterygia]|nr:hypothetical protein C8R44DRAFT_294890 [Mycena epipterygia]
MDGTRNSSKVSSAFRAQCVEVVGPLPFHFSSRVTVEDFDDRILKLFVNSSPFQRGISLSVESQDPAKFPTSGFEFTGENYSLNVELYAAGLADKEATVKQILDDLSTFLDRSNPSVIPVADQKTHIVCVLGPSDLNADENDWIAADFALLYHAFGGVAASETWITSENLHRHAAKRGELLHRSNQQPWRLVLNENTPQFYNIVQDTFAAFDKSLRATVGKAKSDERIIVIMCGHGAQFTGSVRLGDQNFSKARMQGILCQSEAPTTVLTTTCYSGLWAIPYRISAFQDPAQPAESTGDHPRTLPAVCREGMAEKVIDIFTFGSTTAARAASEKFSDFAHMVTSKLPAKHHPASSLYLTLYDQDSSVTIMLDLRDEVALLYRLSALRELPLRANYSTVPLGVEQIQGRILTGGLGTTVLARAQHYWTTYHPPLDYNLLSPYNLRIAMGTRKLKKGRLDEESIKSLLLNVNIRIELDDGANLLAAHIASSKDDKGHSGRPSILNWDPQTYDAGTMVGLGHYFDGLQSRLSPGWQEVLSSNSGPIYGRPTCFLSCVAYEHGYKTVAEVEPVVSSFFHPRRPPSIPFSASLPNLGPALNECIDSLTQSLSMTTISPLVGQ